MTKSVVIIGAGVGGLAAAIRLARGGCKVTVLEKNPQSGGLIFEHSAGGFHWDIGPNLFYSRALLQELFDDVERDMQAYLRLLPIDPQTRYFFPDGDTFQISRDWAQTAAEIARLDRDGIAGYLRFLAYAAELHQMRQYGFASALPKASPSASPSLFRSWLRAGPFGSAYNAGQPFIRSQKLRRVIASCLAHSGGSPYSLPKVYNEMAHAMLSDGLWYPREGLYAIPLALQRLAAELEVSFRFNCPVERIDVQRNRAIGVTLAAASEFLRADAVVSNVDPISTARYLLPQETVASSTLRSLAKTPASASAFVMLLGIRGTFPRLAHHNVFFSDDYRAEFEQLFRRGIMPDDPTVSLTISCKTDALNAPINQENWLIRVSAPPISEKIDWSTQRLAIRDRILSHLQQRYGLDIGDKIRVEKHLTPVDLQRISAGWRGALYGELPHGRRAALQRPQIRSRFVKNLYQVGGRVVPGGAFPHALLSAKAAAALLIQDLR